MARQMHLTYGSHLPPGTDGPTCGELRIRVERMILREDVVEAAVRSESASAKARPISVSVDHCAVAPLFRGEVRPSAQCTPTTPGKARGVVSLVYPIKVQQPQFVEYLESMDKSPNGGVHVLVFIPTSYSGRRRPTHIGKSTVALSRLKPSSPIGGWFHIMRESSATDSKTAGKGHSPVTLVEVGKMKLTFSVTHYTQPAPPRKENLSSVTTQAEQPGGVTIGEQPVRDGQGGGAPGATATSSPTLVGVNVISPQDYLQGGQRPQAGGSVKDNWTAPGAGPAPHVMQEPPAPLFSSSVPRTAQFRTMEMPAVVPTTQQDIVNLLLQRGLKLRAKMEEALHPSGFIGEDPPCTGGHIPILPYANSIQGAPLPTSVALGNDNMHISIPVSEDGDTSGTAQCSLSDMSTKGAGDSSSVSTRSNNGKSPGEQVKQFAASPHAERMFLCAAGSSVGSGYVEVDLSRISFASGPATVGMEEMRIDVRLSKDVKTDEPVESYSSYVHRVPLAKGPDHHIVIGFQLRSFSEDKSRMVISFFRVYSAPVSNPPSEMLLPAPRNAKRVLVKETLLGICIVGLHAQSRDIVAHDPFSGEDPTQAHLCVRLGSCVPARVNGGIMGGAFNHTTGANVATSPHQGGSTHHEDKGGVIHPENPRVVMDEAMSDTTEGSQGNNDSTKSCSSSSPTPPSTSRLQMSRRLSDGADGRKQLETYPMHLQSTAPVEAMSENRDEMSGKTLQAIVASRPPTDDQDMNRPMSGSSSDRFRMHVAIRACKELPLVAMRRDGHPLVSTVVPTDQMANGVRSALASDGSLVLIDCEHRVFRPPSTFFAIEDIYSTTGSSSASRGVVPDWYVEAAVRGEFDRTVVVSQSQSPQYDYECILSLPREAVFLRQVSAEKQRALKEENVAKRDPAPEFSPTLLEPNNASTQPGMGGDPVPCLCDMRLTLWHHAPEADGGTIIKQQSEEEKLWANAAPLGECRVDLRTLRFLRVIDGWYRINGVDRPDTVVGYVRVSVRML